jgi:hypothetical protein
MKLPRRTFLDLAAGAAALPVSVAWAHAYPAQPVRMSLALPWRRDRHNCTPDRSMAVGAARPSILHRESGPATEATTRARGSPLSS